MLDRIVHRVALEIGYDVSEGLAPDLRRELETEATIAYEQWREAAAAGAEPVFPGNALDDLLRALHAIDLRIETEGGATPIPVGLDAK